MFQIVGKSYDRIRFCSKWNNKLQGVNNKTNHSYKDCLKTLLEGSNLAIDDVEEISHKNLLRYHTLRSGELSWIKAYCLNKTRHQLNSINSHSLRIIENEIKTNIYEDQEHCVLYFLNQFNLTNDRVC